jgi:hypothetical protein
MPILSNIFFRVFQNTFSTTMMLLYNWLYTSPWTIDNPSEIMAQEHPASKVLTIKSTPHAFADHIRFRKTSTQHDYSTKSEGITVDETIAMASAHFLPDDTVWHGTDSKAWT